MIQFVNKNGDKIEIQVTPSGLFRVMKNNINNVMQNFKTRDQMRLITINNDFDLEIYDNIYLSTYVIANQSKWVIDPITFKIVDCPIVEEIPERHWKHET